MCMAVIEGILLRHIPHICHCFEMLCLKQSDTPLKYEGYIAQIVGGVYLTKCSQLFIYIDQIQGGELVAAVARVVSEQ